MGAVTRDGREKLLCSQDTGATVANEDAAAFKCVQGRIQGRTGHIDPPPQKKTQKKIFLREENPVAAFNCVQGRIWWRLPHPIPYKKNSFVRASFSI